MRKSLLIAIACFALGKVQAQTYLEKDFDDQSTTSGGWMIQDVTNPDVITSWTTANTASPDGTFYGKCSSYSGGNHDLETWLISPSMDLSSSTTPTLSFMNAYNYTGTALVVKISTDYDGSSSPSTATWNTLSVNLSSGSWAWINSGNVDLSAYNTTDVYVAFIYEGNTSGGSTWEIDDILINEGGAVGPGVHSIYEIQNTISTGDMSYYVDSLVVTGGIVTAVRADSRYYIQSGNGAWTGIYVYDNANAVVVGDSVTMTALVAEFNGLTELKNVSNFVNVSSGNSVPQTFATTAQSMTEDYEGVLVTMQTATCTQATDAFGEWTINDGSGDALIDDFIYPYTSTMNSVYEVTGIVDYAFGAFKVQPRMASDIVVESGASVNELSKSIMTVYPNPSNGTVYVKNYDFINSINVYNLIGEVVLSTNQPKFELEAGVYIVKIGNTAKKVIVK